ncbi:MAG: YihY/virulence factor BrkB family protein [Deltaproteobacteria bacterium]|nr:YihY/virulence factor BrkB family protein [Deltaproteobacteria bacterium]
MKRKNFRETMSLSWLIFVESIKSFINNDSYQTAANLAYYGFFSLIPLLLLVVILLSNLTLSSEQVLKGTQTLAEEIMPQSSEVLLKEIYTLAAKRIWGLYSTIALLWIIIPFASALRSAFAQVFKMEQTIGFVKEYLLSVVAAFALLVLFIVLVVTRIVYSIVLGNVVAAFPIIQYAATIVPLMVSLLFVGFFFFVFCPVKLTKQELVTGSLITTLLFFVIRPIFVMILRINPDFGYAFGSLKAVFVLTVWVYYSFLVVLFGSEVMANIRRRDALLVRGLFLGRAGVPKKRSPFLAKFVRDYDVNTILFEKGDPGGEMFYILSGSVAVKNNGATIRTLGAGDYFGEMAMLLNEPRTATIAIASPGTQLVAISQYNFETLLRENPAIVRSILKDMALRLKATTQQL